MPIGLGVLTLQYFAEIIKLLTGREPPFGLPPKATRRTPPIAAHDAVGDAL